MPLFARPVVAWLVLLAACIAPLRAKPPAFNDKPAPSVPLRPESRQDLDRAEALKLYALAVIQERDNRLIESARTLEQALRLDATAAPLHRALIPLYLALDRTDEALSACRQVLELDPGDYETWYGYAHQLKVQDRPKEAADALVHAVACAGMKDHPDQRMQMNFELGVLYENAQDFARAEAALREAVRALDNPEALLEQGPYTRDEIDAQAAETYERLGKVCIRAGHLDQARTAFVKAQAKIQSKDKDADSIRARRLDRNLADVYLAQGKLTEALQALDQYLATQPQGTEAYELKITILRRLGRDADVVPAIEKYARDDRQNVAIKMLLAKEYARGGQPDRAETLYKALAAESPGPEIYRGLFTLYKEEEKAGRGGARRALDLFNETVAAATSKDEKGEDAVKPQEAAKARAVLAVLRDDADTVKAMLPAIQQRLVGPVVLNHQTRFLLAVLASRTNQLDAAEQLYWSCLERIAGRPRSNEHEVYLGLLRILALEHKHEEVVKLCRKGLAEAQETNLTVFHIELARALVLLGKTDEAIAEANAGVDVSRAEDRLQCRKIRVEVLAQAERYDRAVAECEAMLKEYTQPEEQHTVRSTLSGVYQMAHNYPKAEEQLQKVLEEDPDDATANNDLGYIWADQGKNLAAAEKMIRKAIDLDRKARATDKKLDTDSDQDNGAYVDSLGWVLFRRGQVKEAKAELEKAAALPAGIDDPVMWDHLGDVCFKLGETARARAHWVKAVDLYENAKRRQPDERYKEIKQKLKLLERDTQP